MRRREFVALLGGATIARPLRALAQRPAKPVIGFLSSGSQRTFGHYAVAFVQGLKETGYVDGVDVTIEYRWAEGQYDRLSAMADELVRQPVAVLERPAADRSAGGKGGDRDDSHRLCDCG